MSEVALDQQALANMPAAAEQDTSLPATQQGSPTDEANLPTEPSSNPIVRFMEQPAVKRSLPAAIAVLTLAVCIIFYMWISAPGYRSVYPGMIESDRQAAYDLLISAGYDVFIDVGTGELQITNDTYHEARMLLASQNIPKAASLGTFSDLIEQGSLTRSRFMEQVGYRAAMESELARTIERIGTVASARVHIAESQQSVFVRNQTPSKASVVVKTYPGRKVSQAQIQAMVHLVSSSVPYLVKENVTIVDDMGQLLTDSESDAAMEMTAAQMEHKSIVETRYQSRIQQLLSAIVGLGNVRSEIDVTMNFTEVESTFEEFDRGGAGSRTRSESLMYETSSQLDAAGVPGSFSNDVPGSPAFTQTNAVGGAGGVSGQESGNTSSSTTRNYELDREIRYVKQQVGAIEKISAAVVINDEAYRDEEGILDQARVDSDVDRIREIVRGAIGFDEVRGDVVTVVSTAFARPVEELPEGPWYLEPDKLDSYIKIASVIVILFLIYFLLARPFLKAQQMKEEFEIPTELADPDGISDEERQLVELGDVETIKEVTARLKPKQMGIPAEYLDTSQPYDQKVALMRFLVKDDIGRVSNMLKRWIDN
jgi:flagellar M-ring protein FliF